MNSLISKVFYLFAVIAALAAIFAGLFTANFAVSYASAQTNPANDINFRQAGNIFGQTSSREDIRLTIFRLVNYALSFIGIVMLGMFLWGGYRWFMSRGDSSEVDAAKSTLRNAVIGLVIITTSYGVITFIFRQFMESDPNSLQNQQANAPVRDNFGRTTIGEEVNTWGDSAQGAGEWVRGLFSD